MNWEEKCRLIHSDSVTCARHFDNQIGQFLTKFPLSDVAPLGKISNWFHRAEYQQRFTSYSHVNRLENAPQFSIDSDADMASYIDNIITCQRPTDNYKILKLLNRQVQTFSYLSEECKK